MFYEQFEELNRYRWSGDEMQKNYEIALQVEKNYYEKYGTAKEPKIGDIVEYSDGWQVYRHASIVENLYYEDNTRVCICDNGSSFTNGKYFSTSGGAFHGKDKSALQYVGEDENIVWTWGCYGAGADHGIYIPLKVNKWIIPYNPKEVKRSTVYFNVHRHDDTCFIGIQNSDSIMYYEHTFESLKAFEAWAKYVGYEYHMDGEVAYSPQRLARRCWTTTVPKPENGKPIKVLANGRVHDGLVVTDELCITEWWENIWKPEQEPKYGTPEWDEEMKTFHKYYENPMGV